jgi:hypothetical protein
MTTVLFISGSIKINRLNKDIKNRLQNALDQNFDVVVGDANGADKALQKYLSEVNYNNVVVYCAGNVCRNNIGNWKVRRVPVDSRLKGREFYTQKDKEMADTADYGFVLWDGKSPGSFNNIMELLKNNKKALVYFSPDKNFYPVSKLEDAENLLSKCDRSALDQISKKIKLGAQMREVENMAQSVLSF